MPQPIYQSKLPTDGFTIKPQNLHRFFSSGPDKHFDHLWRLGLSGSSIDSALFNVDYQGAFAYDTNANPTWQYIKNTDADNEIVGRYAYMVIAADRPLADLSTMVFARKEPLKEGATEKRTPGTATDYQRAGLVPEELNPNILWNAIASPTAYASTFNAEIGNWKIRPSPATNSWILSSTKRPPPRPSLKKN